MSIHVRQPNLTDWDAILKVANQSAPWDTKGANQEWVVNRKNFNRRGKQYIAESTELQQIIAFGAIEEDSESGVFRLFIVTHPDNLYQPASDLLYEKLQADLKILKATRIWTREYTKDKLNDYFKSKGFTEVKRFQLPDHDEMLITEKYMSEG